MSKVPMFQPYPPVDNTDIDKAMWRGATPTPYRPSPEAPPKARQPHLPTAEDLPSRHDPFFPMFWERVPQYPSVWARPFHPKGDICLPFYATEYLAFRFQVPDTRLVMLQSIGYTVDGLPEGDMFLVRVRRDGELIASWEDMVVVNAVNPNERLAFGSFSEPVPVHVRLDKNQTLTVTCTALGPFPFVRTVADVCNAEFTAIPYGYMDRLRDTRDGAPKAVITPDQRNMRGYAARGASFLAAMPELERRWMSESFQPEITDA